MTVLRVVTVSGDAEVDRVTLDADGRLSYRTGAARDLFEGRRRALGGATDAELAAHLTGWSNGYLAIQASEDTDQAGG